MTTVAAVIMSFRQVMSQKGLGLHPNITPGQSFRALQVVMRAGKRKKTTGRYPELTEVKNYPAKYTQNYKIISRNIKRPEMRKIKSAATKKINKSATKQSTSKRAGTDREKYDVVAKKYKNSI